MFCDGVCFCLFLGVLPQNSACVSFQKPFLFHLGLELSYFPHYFPRKCGEKICILVKLKTTLRNQYAGSLREGLWSLSKWRWDCRALHCEWLCSMQKGVICSLFYFLMKPKLLQLESIPFFSYLSLSCNLSFICFHRDHRIMLQLLCVLF